MSQLSKQERQSLWAEKRKEVMRERYALTQVALSEGVEPPAWPPLPLTMPDEFLKPANVHRVVSADYGRRVVEQEPQLSPEQAIALEQSGLKDKAAAALRRVMATQVPAVTEYDAMARPKVREQVLEVAEDSPEMIFARTAGPTPEKHERPQPLEGETLESFFVRTSVEAKDDNNA
jgi:hypothetical protein